jgi:Transglutaminase-like superfamily
MSYYLASHVSCCVTNAGVVFLDLRHNRYYGLERRHLPLLASQVANWPPPAPAPVAQVAAERPGDSEILEPLVPRGILTRQDPGTWRGTADLPAAARAVELPFEPAVRGFPAAQVGLFLLAMIRARVWFRLRSLQFSVTGIERRAARRRDLQGNIKLQENPESRVRELVVMFRRVKPWFYVTKDACLFDSLVLWNYLYYNGICAQLVVGVKNNPFRAHSWVQYGDISLNNDVDDLDAYTPVLVTPARP